MSAQPTIFIDPLSTRSLLLQARFGNTPLSTATGFLVEKNGTYFLITNWHVVTAATLTLSSLCRPQLGSRIHYSSCTM
jgi:hypothetical protein